MNIETSRTTEVVVRIQPRRSESSQEGEKEDRERRSILTYDALIYADPRSLQARADFVPREGWPARMGNLKLSSAESVVVNWGYYKYYLDSFIRGEQAASEKLEAEELFLSVSPGLRKLLKGEAIDSPSLRVWWSTATPSLVELPWELLVYGDESTDREVSFVRGLPPDSPVPVLPVGEKLRLAFIHDPDSSSRALIDVLKEIPGIDVVSITDPPLQALQQAISKGFELVHLVADGSASLAYEGFLYLRKPQRVDISSDIASAAARRGLRMLLSIYNRIEPLLLKPISVSLGLNKLSAWLSSKLYKQLDLETLSTGELSALQRGSPLAVLALSPPKSSGYDLNRIDGFLLPSIYRSFACIGNSSLPMPNIIAQIGATDEERMARFWRRFYGDLGESLQVEKAMRNARIESALSTMALFLRQQHTQTFKHDEASKDVNVTQLSAELAESMDAMEQLKELGNQYSSLSHILEKFEQGESARQEQLKSRLQEWLPEQERRESNDS